MTLNRVEIISVLVILMKGDYGLKRTTGKKGIRCLMIIKLSLKMTDIWTVLDPTCIFMSK